MNATELVILGDGTPVNYVRFVSAEARTITPKYTNSGVTLQYSIDSGATWTTITSGSVTTSATEHWFRGQATGTKSLNTSSNNAWVFSGSSNLEVYGNLNFLLCDTLGAKVAPTSLADYCYTRMFYQCTSLTIAPELPATTLANSCYVFMFSGCTSLTIAPELPATTLANNCYQYMFENCTLLAIAPELPATTLMEYCYYGMFLKCTLLTTAPKLPATRLASNCYGRMFNGCSSLTTAPKLPAITLAEHCYATMFASCTKLTTAPKLPATTLANNCYFSMFQNCTLLTTVPKLPATTLTISCYRNMFLDCISLKVSATNTGSYTYAWRIPTSETGIAVSNWSTYMLKGTGGTFTSNPTINTTYWVELIPENIKIKALVSINQSFVGRSNRDII